MPCAGVDAATKCVFGERKHRRLVIAPRTRCVFCEEELMAADILNPERRDWIVKQFREMTEEVQVLAMKRIPVEGQQYMHNPKAATATKPREGQKRKASTLVRPDTTSNTSGGVSTVPVPRAARRKKITVKTPYAQTVYPDLASKLHQGGCFYIKKKIKQFNLNRAHS
jgi:hypothetical protein